LLPKIPARRAAGGVRVVADGLAVGGPGDSHLMVLDERWLRSHKRRELGAVVAQDRACRRCAYNLRGLREGGTCPECGTEIRGPLVRTFGPSDFMQMPLGQMRLLGVATSALFWGLTLVALGFLGGWCCSMAYLNGWIDNNLAGGVAVVALAPFGTF